MIFRKFAFKCILVAFLLQISPHLPVLWHDFLMFCLYDWLYFMVRNYWALCPLSILQSVKGGDLWDFLLGFLVWIFFFFKLLWCLAWLEPQINLWGRKYTLYWLVMKSIVCLQLLWSLLVFMLSVSTRMLQLQ